MYNYVQCKLQHFPRIAIFKNTTLQLRKNRFGNDCQTLFKLMWVEKTNLVQMFMKDSRQIRQIAQLYPQHLSLWSSDILFHYVTVIDFRRVVIWLSGSFNSTHSQTWFLIDSSINFAHCLTTWHGLVFPPYLSWLDKNQAVTSQEDLI